MSVKPEQKDLANYENNEKTYTKVDTTAGSVSGVTIAVPKATAVFYGTVKDNLGNPFSGVAIYSSDNNDNYETDGYSDAAGNYVAGLLADRKTINGRRLTTPAALPVMFLR